MLITNFLPSEDLVKKQLIVMIFVFVLVYVFSINCVYLLTDSGGFRSRRAGRLVYDAKITIVCGITMKTLRDFLGNSGFYDERRIAPCDAAAESVVADGSETEGVGADICCGGGFAGIRTGAVRGLFLCIARRTADRGGFATLERRPADRRAAGRGRYDAIL